MGFAAAATLAAAAVSAYAAYQQGQQASDVARYNRKVALNQAEQAKQAAAVAAENRREETQRLLATQRARAGASGIMTEEGSPLLVMLESEETALVDIARIRAGGQRQAEGFTAEAGFQGYAGRQARRAGTLNASASLLSGVASAYGSYRGSGTTATTGTSPGYGRRVG